MTHATVLVICKNPELVEAMMYPFWELDLSPEEMKNDSRAVFVEKFKRAELKSKFESFLKKQKKRMKKNNKIINEDTREEAIVKIKEKNIHIRPYSDSEIVEMAIKRKLDLEDIFNRYKTPQYWLENWNNYYLNKEETAYGYYHNPNQKWDWYSIGGRYTGHLKLKDGMIAKWGERGEPSWTWEYTDNDPYDNNAQMVDIAQVKDLDEQNLKKRVFYAVLDEDGWHEKSRLGWFGCEIPSGYCCVPDKFPKKYLDKYIFSSLGCWRLSYLQKLKRLLDKYYTYDKKTKEFARNDIKEEEELRNETTFFTDLHWKINFYDRFLKDINPELYLVVVDYHI